MEPYIHDGDLALVRLQNTLEDGDVGVIIFGDNEATLKKFRCEGDRVMLEPFNEKYGKIPISGHELEQMVIFGKVVETKTKW